MDHHLVAKVAFELAELPERQRDRAAPLFEEVRDLISDRVTDQTDEIG
jgi:hypothetical protein